MKLFLLCIVSLISVVNSARILGIVPTPSYSHQTAFRPLWKELSLRGHQVVLLTTNPMNNTKLTNLTEIHLKENFKLFKDVFTQEVMKEAINNPLRSINKIMESVSYLSNSTLQNGHVKKLIADKSEHFDLVLTEVPYRLTYMLSKRFDCHFIGIFSLDTNVGFHNLMGNPAHPILQPGLLPFDSSKMSFKNRIISCFANLYMRLVPLLPSISGPEKMLKKMHFPNLTLDLDELAKEMSMLFLNVNPVFWGIRPVNPNTIMFGGGVHIEEPKPLPKDLDNFLNSNPEGVIYFSLGSNLRSNMLDESFKQIIVETIKSLPYKVLWKYESDRMENKPANVKILKWIPQQDVLRHPNIKLFITQGGLQSIEEAMHNSVPLVVIPFFGDQPGNAYRIQEKAMGLFLDHKTLTTEEFRTAILEVINNEKYRKNIKKNYKLMKDQPMTGLEKLVWWTEYVIRNKGAKHFKNVGVNLPLYQYFLLDVIAFFAVILLTTLLIVWFIFKQIRKIIFDKIVKSKVD